MTKWTIMRDAPKVGVKSAPRNYFVRALLEDGDVIDALVCMPEWDEGRRSGCLEVWAERGNYEIEQSLIVELQPPTRAVA